MPRLTPEQRQARRIERRQARQAGKKAILTEGITARETEVMYREINITNYEKAIAKIDAEHADDPEMQKHKAHIQKLLDGEKREKLKEEIMIEVSENQIEDIDEELGV